MQHQLQQDQGMPELVLKLAAPYLAWKELLNTFELVCTRWRNTLGADDVWRPICDLTIKEHETWVFNFRQVSPDREEMDCSSPSIDLLTSQMESDSGRSLRDIFLLSERLGGHLWQHLLHGPDSRKCSDPWTLRENLLHDYHWIVAPTIATLRQVFDDHGKSGRLEDMTNMKKKLLDHARNEPVLRRRVPSCMEKEELALGLGRYLLAAATNMHKSLADSAFIPSSAIEVTVGEIVEGIETFTGEVLSSQVSLQLKRTPGCGLESDSRYQPATKKPRSHINDLDWPLNPVDGICFLIRKSWPSESDDSENSWDDTIQKWWDGLAEPMCKMLMKIQDDMAARYTDIDPLQQGCKASEVPLEVLKDLAELPYCYVRKKIAKTILNNIDTGLRESMFQAYHQHSTCFLDRIRQEYRSVYEERDPEYNAKLLLDIFLEVLPDTKHTSATVMNSDYCNGLLERMENEMNEWDQLVDSASVNPQDMWDPETYARLNSLESKFAIERTSRMWRPCQEFCTGVMVTRFLYQTLSSEVNLSTPDFYSMKEFVEKMVKDGERIAEIYNGSATMPDSEKMALITSILKRLEEFRTFASLVHTREHAMIALMPLLSDLSEFDSKRLVYALFIQRKKVGRGFVSFVDLDPGGFYDGAIPVPQNNLDDLPGARDWIRDYSRRRYGQHGVLERLFGLPLPQNIISAMAEFLLERLYRQSLYDVDSTTYSHALGVLPFMERFCNESPDEASIVWDCLNQALRNAIGVVHEHGPGIGESEGRTLQFVIGKLFCSCIHTRAKKVIPEITRVYAALEDLFHLPNEIIGSLNGYIEDIQDAPAIHLDSRDYYSPTDYSIIADEKI